MVMVPMNAPVVSFKQRNNFTRLEPKLHPDYVEYYVAGARGTNTGFNAKYELLPKEFDYRIFRQKDMFVIFPLVLVAALTPFELFNGEGDPFFTIATRK